MYCRKYNLSISPAYYYKRLKKLFCCTRPSTQGASGYLNQIEISTKSGLQFTGEVLAPIAAKVHNLVNTYTASNRPTESSHYKDIRRFPPDIFKSPKPRYSRSYLQEMGITFPRTKKAECLSRNGISSLV